MKIINNNDCYIQRDDIEYLVDNNRDIPNELFLELNMSVFDDHDFIKIQNPIAKRYVLQSNIPTFDELNEKSLDTLEDIIFKIKLAIFDSDDELTSKEIEEINEIIRERRNREYWLKQIKEIVAFKKRVSKLEYPNIPNPNMCPLSDGKYNATISLNSDKVIIYNLNGSEVKEGEDLEFCETAYKLLMHDYMDVESIGIKTFVDGKYLVVEGINNKRIRKRFIDKSRY